MIGSGTRKGMRRKGAKKAGLRLAYDGLTKRKRKVSRKTKKMRKSTRKGMRRKGAKRGGGPSPIFQDFPTIGVLAPLRPVFDQ